MIGARRTRRLVHDHRAALTLEAALVMLPFLSMLFFVFGTGLQLFTQATLDAATRSAARQIRIGTLRGTSDSGFRTAVCNMMSNLAACGSLNIYVTSGPSFAALAPAAPGGSGLTHVGFSPGNANDYVLVQVSCPAPFPFPLAPATGTTFVADAVFRNEP